MSLFPSSFHRPLTLEKLRKTLGLIILLFILISLPISVYTILTQRLETRKKAQESLIEQWSSNLWQEITSQTNSPDSLIVSKEKVEGKIFDSSSRAGLPITGQWQNRSVKIVPNDYFDDLFKWYGGVTAIEKMNDGRLFLGAYNGFAVKSPGDSDWQSLTYFYLASSLKINAITSFTQTISFPYDIYINGLDGAIRYQSDGSMSVIPDPSGGRLKANYFVPYISYNGMIAYKKNALYYLENETVRKWLTPIRYPCAWPDDILTFVTDTTTTPMKTFGIIREGCPGTPEYKTYLYQFVFSSNPEIPLQMIQLGEVINQQSLGKSTISWRAFDGQKILYGQPELTTNKIPVISYFKTDGSPITISRYTVDTTGGSPELPAGFVEDKTSGITDNVWIIASEVRGVYLGTYFDREDVAYSFVRTEDTGILANPYLESFTVDPSGRVYLGHQYLTGQFNDALVTIFEPPSITPTPIPLPTFTPTPTPTPRPTPTPTPPTTPTPTPTPTPPVSHRPVIVTQSLPEGTAGSNYSALVLAFDLDRDLASLQVEGLPQVIKSYCLEKDLIGFCLLYGRPLQAGTSAVKFTVTDDQGNLSSKTYTLVIH